MDTHDIKGYSEYSNELDQGPTDKGSLVWLICCLLGAGNLFPWNAWITPYDYFTELYPKYPFEFAISLVFNYATVLFLFVGIKVGTSFSIKSRMMFGLLVDLVVLLIVPWIPYMGMDKFSAFMITLTLVFISGVATAVLFGTTLGVASIFPPKYITAVMVGNGVAGVVVGGIRIITKAAIPNDTNTSTIIYFMIAAFVILLNIFGYLALQKLPYAVYHMQKANVSVQNQDDKQPLLSVEKRPGEEISKMQVFKKIWKEALTVMFVFFISLGFFPGMTSLIKPKNENVMGSWFAVVMIALFQLFDFVGRSLPNFIILFSKRTLWIPCILRTVTVVLFLLCLKPFIFQSFWWPMIFMGIFAITNGYCGTLAMMYGPTDADTNEKETAGIIMSFFLNMGIFLGVHFALIFLLFH